MLQKIQIQKNIFWVHIRVLWSSFPLHWKPNILLVNYDSWWQHQISVHELRHNRPSGRFSKSLGFLSASVSFLKPFFTSLTFVPCSLLLNHTEMLATQAILRPVLRASFPFPWMGFPWLCQWRISFRIWQFVCIVITVTFYGSWARTSTVVLGLVFLRPCSVFSLLLRFLIRSDFLKHLAIKNCVKTFLKNIFIPFKNFLKSIQRFDVLRRHYQDNSKKIQYECSINIRKTIVH